MDKKVHQQPLADEATSAVREDEDFNFGFDQRVLNIFLEADETRREADRIELTPWLQSVIGELKRAGLTASTLARYASEMKAWANVESDMARRGFAKLVAQKLTDAIPERLRSQEPEPPGDQVTTQASGSARKLNDFQIKDLEQRFRKRESVSSLAKNFKVARSTIDRYLRQAELKTKPQSN